MWWSFEDVIFSKSEELKQRARESSLELYDLDPPKFLYLFNKLKRMNKDAASGLLTETPSFLIFVNTEIRA